MTFFQRREYLAEQADTRTNYLKEEKYKRIQAFVQRTSALGIRCVGRRYILIITTINLIEPGSGKEEDQRKSEDSQEDWPMNNDG